MRADLKSIFNFMDSDADEKRPITLSLSVTLIKKLDIYLGRSKIISRSKLINFLLNEFLSSDRIRPLDALTNLSDIYSLSPSKLESNVDVKQ